MIKKIEDLNFYELLEISPSASSQDIHRAYERVRKIYEPNSVALYSLFTPEETAKIRQRIEEAYRTLIYDENRREYDRMLRARHELPESASQMPQHRPLQPAASPLPDIETPQIPRESPEASAVSSSQSQSAPEQPPPAVLDIREFTGEAIRMVREHAGLTIRAVASMTKVGERYLERIEEEKFSKLPPRAYLRGFLVLIAKVLRCDQERLVSDYLKRYDAVMGKQK